MTELTESQRNLLKDLLARPSQYKNLGCVEAFVLQYIFFESVCREIGNFYRSRSGAKKKLRAKATEGFRMDVVARSLSYFGVRLRADILNKLLNSRLQKHGSRSARNLRNALVHEWRLECYEETYRRFKELTMALQAAIAAVSNRLKAKR